MDHLKTLNTADLARSISGGDNGNLWTFIPEGHWFNRAFLG